jgi:hypothetical protein
VRHQNNVEKDASRLMSHPIRKNRMMSFHATSSRPGLQATKRKRREIVEMGFWVETAAKGMKSESDRR